MKKIKDLTLDEAFSICKSHMVCSFCELADYDYSRLEYHCALRDRDTYKKLKNKKIGLPDKKEKNDA